MFRLLKRASANGMQFDHGAVQADDLKPNADQLLMLQFLEQPIEYSGFRPAVHASVDRVPVAEMLG